MKKFELKFDKNSLWLLLPALLLIVSAAAFYADSPLAVAAVGFGSLMLYSVPIVGLKNVRVENKQKAS